MEAASRSSERGARPRSGDRATLLSGALLAVTVGLLVASLLLTGLHPGPVAVSTWYVVTSALGAITVVRARSRVGWLIQVAIALAAIAQFGQAFARDGVAAGDSGFAVSSAAWVSQWLPLPSAAMFVFVFLLFPDGSLPSSRWRVAAVAAGIGIVLGSGILAITPGPLAAIPAMNNPLGIAGIESVIEALETAGSFLLAFATVAALASLFVRFRRATGEQRAQIKWVLYAAALLFLTGAFAMAATGALNELSFIALLVGLFALPVALTVALTKYRLYDIDIVVNRTIVYSLLTAAVIVLYILIVGVMGALLQRRVGLVPALVATGVVAVVFQPLRRASQNAVDRMMFGQRRDPYGALANLASKLESTFDPEEIIPSIVETVSRSLKLAYVGIEVENEGRSETAASAGEPDDHVESVPLVYQGEEVGRLVVSPRRGDALTETDRRLLADLARSAGPAVHAVALTEALRRSRNELLAAREEERRRLRRDLHDGLGPELAGISLGVGAALNLAGQDGEQTRDLLAKIKSQADAATRSIRGLVDGLRPAALDDLGLVGAVREKAAAIASRGGMQFEISAPPELPELPAAVEVAAMRIALEAVTNAVRHSGGSRCTVTFTFGEDVVVEVTDDGVGMTPDARGGVGLVSMRERAAEVGGSTSSYEAARGGGTVVRAVLPIR